LNDVGRESAREELPEIQKNDEMGG